jgi:hypothetical protein
MTEIHFRSASSIGRCSSKVLSKIKSTSKVTCASLVTISDMSLCHKEVNRSLTHNGEIPGTQMIICSMHPFDKQFSSSLAHNRIP